MAELESLTMDDLRKCATHLVESYSDDIQSSSIDDFVQFKAILDADQYGTITHISELLKLDGGQLQTTFPNVDIALRIISVNNFQGRVSFSTLSRVKNYLWNIMGHERLTAFATVYVMSSHPITRRHTADR
ncbi:hypothetical protein DPMN_077755 [Dreissena polymorpha]|uniref:Uncharacterized protein n=1 Tax=Dreissena polymorpha TaxID=45954 RepID=A0A9D3YPY1_DREPO|nr:hypothetical protein DPMN_077755 [Dreissena polymorpha]